MARLYQKINGEAVPLGGGGGGSVAIDNVTITENSDDAIQVATTLTSKINQLNNSAADMGKVLTANGDGTAEWKEASKQGFYGTKEEWEALSYVQQKAWIEKSPRVTLTNDYFSSIKQNVAECLASTSEDDVCGASVVKELNVYSTTPKIVGKYMMNGVEKLVYQKSYTKTITVATGEEPIDRDFSVDRYRLISIKGTVSHITGGVAAVINPLPFVFWGNFDGVDKAIFITVNQANNGRGLQLTHNWSNFAGRVLDVTIEYIEL